MTVDIYWTTFINEMITMHQKSVKPVIGERNWGKRWSFLMPPTHSKNV